MLKLYDYCRSSACFRVRIALHLKKLDVEQISVHLLKNHGEHLQASYLAINPQALVPTLEDTANQLRLTQSLAIIEYLEEAYPQVTLLPSELIARAKVRSFAQAIACDIHPLNNLRVLKYLKQSLHTNDEQKTSWYHHWINEGFQAIESLLQEQNGLYCFGDLPGLADVCLVPQVFNAIRFELSMEPYPLIHQKYQQCLQHPAFIRALPENQPDAEM